MIHWWHQHSRCESQEVPQILFQTHFQIKQTWSFRQNFLLTKENRKMFSFSIQFLHDHKSLRGWKFCYFPQRRFSDFLAHLAREHKHFSEKCWETIIQCLILFIWYFALFYQLFRLSFSANFNFNRCSKNEKKVWNFDWITNFMARTPWSDVLSWEEN